MATDSMRELSHLKSKARSLYVRYQDRLDQYSCGANLAEYISPDMAEMRMQFNAAWDRIKELDPSAPENPMK